MRLRNKKTGEVVKRIDLVIREEGVVFNIDEQYHSLAELNEEWEDYEEPKEYWAIDIYSKGAEDFKNSNDDVDKFNKEIGNYFDTREEAEKAVEKLKAWKRLKDNGYRFNGVGVEYDGYKIHLECDIMKKEHYTPTQDHKDMDLLFGGEE